jgi:STE24 endopeptidase
VVPLLLVTSGLSHAFAGIASGLTENPHAALIAFAALCGIVYVTASLPLDFATEWVVERRFGMSSRSAFGWWIDRTKALAITIPPSLAVLLVFSWALHAAGVWWWVPVAAAISLLSLLLGRVGPAILIRVFYRISPLAESGLKERIAALCWRSGFDSRGVFTFNMSRTTNKANATLTGIGGARRILLADTLLTAFSEEEIETVVAHELGHYHHRHIAMGIGIGIVGITAALFAVALLHRATLSWAGASSITDLAALPLLPFWLILLGTLTGPMGNALSRRRERQADAFAVSVTGNRQAFASALRKLADINLSDPEPHPAVELLFSSHPSIARRLRMVEGA